MRSSDHVVSVALGGHIMLFLMDVITQTFDFYDKGGRARRRRVKVGSLLPQAAQCRSDRLMDRQWLQAVALDMQQDVEFSKQSLCEKESVFISGRYL